MRRRPGIIALVVGLIVNAAVSAQPPAAAPETFSYPLWEFGTMPNESFKDFLLEQAAVREELKLTAAQVEKIGGVEARQSEAAKKASIGIADAEKAAAAEQRIYNEAHAVIMEILEPGQRDRLDQIQLQSQGPLAFNPSRIGILAYEGPPLSRRLGLSEDQARRVGEIAEAGDKEIEKAATITVTLDPLLGWYRNSILETVRTPEFKAAKRKARKDAREAWAAVMRRIEAALTGPQREAYRAMLGSPFDVFAIRLDGQAYNRSKTTSNLDESSSDASILRTALRDKGRRK
jgi:hypothetical protein